MSGSPSGSSPVTTIRYRPYGVMLGMKLTELMTALPACERKVDRRERVLGDPSVAEGRALKVINTRVKQVFTGRERVLHKDYWHTRSRWHSHLSHPIPHPPRPPPHHPLPPHPRSPPCAAATAAAPPPPPPPPPQDSSSSSSSATSSSSFRPPDTAPSSLPM